MSSLTKRMSKKVKDPSLQFEPDLYTNIVGSLIITHYILRTLNTNQDSLSKQEINKRWKKLKKDGLDFWLDDPEFIPKVLKMFEMEPIYGQFAMVQSKYNTLFAPYIDNQILPLHENGIVTPTLKYGKVYLITEETENAE